MASRLDPDQEKAELAELVATHGGNCAAIARELTDRGRTITRQGVSLRLKKYGLVEEADVQRAAAGVSGARVTLAGQADPIGEKEALVQTLRQHPSKAAAAAALGLSRKTLYRKLHAYGLDPAALRKKSAASK